MTIDGVSTEVEAFDLGDGEVMLKYGLDGLSNGMHEVSVKAKNIWGESEPVPFSFTREDPPTPVGIGLSSE